MFVTQGLFDWETLLGALTAPVFTSKASASNNCGTGKGRFNPATRHRARSPVTPGIAILNACGYQRTGRNELSIPCLPTEDTGLSGIVLRNKKGR